MICTGNTTPAKHAIRGIILVVAVGVVHFHCVQAQEATARTDTSRVSRISTDASHLVAAPKSAADSASVIARPGAPGIDYLRFGVVSAAAASTVGAAYIAVKTSWWSEHPSKFHLDNGPDLKYARNVDKAAHFFGGNLGADAFARALEWSHFERRDALLYGAAFSSFVQMAMEIKDGFAPRWGFSVWDVGSGMVGSMVPWLKETVPVMRNFDLKFSYWKRSNRYYEYDANGAWNDDYINQTYWVSAKVHYLLPRAWRPYWPSFLAVASGISLDDKADGAGAGHVELLLALDVDITALFPDASPFWATVLHYLNHVKFPAPAVRITPGAIWYGLYF